MPITNGNYSVPNNFVQQYNLGQKKIRADLVDENFTDVADVINDLIDDDALTVHTNDNQTISGDKTFTGDVNLTGDVLMSGDMTITGNLDVSAIASDLASQIKNNILQQVFPVGSLYMTTSDANPATTFGFGTWSKIEGRMIIGASSSYAVSSTGGEATHKLTVNETPAHTHSRGTMNIKGYLDASWEDSRGANASGAFYSSSPGGTANEAAGNGSGARRWNFDASRNWTGATSSVGGGAAHNNIPPYYAAYIWRRTA